MTELWVYPLRQGERLTGPAVLPIFTDRLLSSRFLAYTLAENRRGAAFTGLILWAEAMRQDPAGTLPDDDVQLACLARLPLSEWHAARDWALYGWRQCHVIGAGRSAADRRLGHPVLSVICEDQFHQCSASGAPGRRGGVA